MEQAASEIFAHTPAFRDLIEKCEAAQAMFAEQRERLLSDLNPQTLQFCLWKRESDIREGMHHSQWIFERSVTKASEDIRMVQGMQASQGGKSKRCDALQDVIVSIVSKGRNISETDLLNYLKGLEGGGFITGIDDPDPDPTGGARKIYYMDRKREKSAPVSGLKDRLTRAKKYVDKLSESNPRECQ